MVRPLGVPVADSTERAGLGAEDPSGEATDLAAPSLPILPPDEYEILKRLEKLEAAVLNQEAVIAMCVYVATTAADRAKGAA